MTTAPEPPVVTASAQHLLVDTEWSVSGRVRVHRRIVTEHRTVEIVVRREIVEFHGETLDFHDGRLIGTARGGGRIDAPAAAPPLVVVLREEVPVVTVQARPYERVTLTTARVEDRQTVDETVQREQIDVSTHSFHDTQENRP